MQTNFHKFLLFSIDIYQCASIILPYTTPDHFLKLRALTSFHLLLSMFCSKNFSLHLEHASNFSFFEILFLFRFTAYLRNRRMLVTCCPLVFVLFLSTRVLFTQFIILTDYLSSCVVRVTAWFFMFDISPLLASVLIAFTPFCDFNFAFLGHVSSHNAIYKIHRER